MGKVTPISEQFQHFVRDLKESFWGDLYGRARPARNRYLVRESYDRVEGGRRG